MSTRGSRLLGKLPSIIALAFGAALVLSVTPARGDPIDLTACNAATLSRPFATWGDFASYELAPGGDFEKPAWTLSGGSGLVRSSEPYAATGKLGSWSLALPAGSSAQSPATCVDAAYPTVRFFVGGTGSVAVTIVAGDVKIPAGIAVAGLGWQPTLVMLTSSAVVASTTDGVAEVSLRLTALSGDPKVDDVFIDPWNRG